MDEIEIRVPGFRVSNRASRVVGPGESRIELTLFTVVRVEGRVDFAVEADPVARRRRTKVHLLRGAPREGCAGATCDEATFERVGRDCSIEVDVAEDGTFALDAPRIHGLTITASAAGYVPGRVVLDGDFLRCTGPYRVRIPLTAAQSLRGRCIDRSGRPVPGASVYLYVTFEEKYVGAFAAKDLKSRFPRGGVSAHSEGADRLVVSVLHPTKADSSGNFAVSGQAEGQVSVVVLARGRPRAVVLDGRHTSNFDGVDVVLDDEVASERRMVVTDAGRRLPRTTINFGCLSDGLPFQPGFSVVSDDQGEITSTWLQPGSRYSVLVERRTEGSGATLRSGFFTWDGGETLELDKLESTLE